LGGIVVFLSVCGGGGSTGNPAEVSDVEVVMVMPSISSTEVDRAPFIGVQFSGDISPPSVDSDNFQLLNCGEPVAGAISFHDTNAIEFSVDDDLDLLSTYMARLTTAIIDVSGLSLVSIFEWSFVTRDGIWREPESVEQGFVDDPVLIADANDTVWAFYRKNDFFTEENEIFARHLLDDNTWSIEQLISNSSDDEDVTGKPQITVLSNGDLLVLWEEDGPGGIPTQLSYNHYSQSNSSWGDSERINASAFAHIDPRFMADDSGNVMAVFEIAGMGPTNISTLIYDTDNDQWSDAATIDELEEEAGHSRVSINNQGDAMVVWLQTDHVYSRLYRFSTGTWGAVELVDNIDAGTLQLGLALPVDFRGIFTAVWSQEDDALGFPFIWSNRYTLGEGWTKADVITGSVQGFNPQLVIDRDDNIILVWQQDPVSGENNILICRFNALGGRWSAIEFLEVGEQPASQPQLTIDESGNAMAIWQQNRSGTFFDNNSIIYNDPPSTWVRRFNKIDESWLAPQAISALGGAIDRPAIVNSSNGEIVALWMQVLEGQSIIQSRRFD